LFLKVEEYAKQETIRASYMLHAGFILGLLFDPEDGGDIFLRNLC
jgi:hypothetical protein